MWMGVSDKNIQPLKAHLLPHGEQEEDKKKQKSLLVVTAALYADEKGSLEPTDLGEQVVAEFNANRLHTAMVGTASFLEAASVSVQTVRMDVPPREQVAKHMPNLSVLRSDADQQLSKVILEIAAMEAGIKQQKKPPPCPTEVPAATEGGHRPRTRASFARTATQKLREAQMLAAGAVSALRLVGLRTSTVEEDDSDSNGAREESKLALSQAYAARDALVGRIEAIDRLRSATVMRGITIEGEAHSIDEAWNKALPSVREDDGTASAGRFCAYCAQRSPPVLARHRFVDCHYRMLATKPEYSEEAMSDLKADLKQKMHCAVRHVSQLEKIVKRRQKCKTLLTESTFMGRFLRKYLRVPQSAPPPATPPPKILRPRCQPWWPEGRAVISLLVARVAEDAERRFQDLYGESRKPSGVKGICNQYKTLLLMTPRRSLLQGGLRELKVEQEQQELLDASAPTAADVDYGAHVSFRKDTPQSTYNSRAALRRKFTSPDMRKVAKSPGRRKVTSIRNNRSFRRGSVMQNMWYENQHVVDPRAVRDAAALLGIDLSTSGQQFHLLHIAISLAAAPLPSDWQEVMRDGKFVFLEEPTGHVQDYHPLTPHFEEVVHHFRLQRRRPLPREIPSFLAAQAERWVQFVSSDGALFFYDFGSGETSSSYEYVLERLMSGIVFGSDSSSFEDVLFSTDPFECEATAPQPSSTFQRAQYNTEERFGAAITRSSVDDAERARMVSSLRQTFQQVLSASIAATPRLLRHTLEVAISYSIDPIKEPSLVWLADLAVSLPAPSGWTQVMHPTEKIPFWYNELTRYSSWQHPVDDFIKTQIKMLRTPRHPMTLMLCKSRMTS